MMRRLLVLLMTITLFVCAGCSGIGGWYIEHKDELRARIKAHVENRLHTHIEAKVNKLVTDNKITTEYADELKSSLKGVVTSCIDNFYKSDEETGHACTCSTTDK